MPAYIAINAEDLRAREALETLGYKPTNSVRFQSNEVVHYRVPTKDVEAAAELLTEEGVLYEVTR